MEQNMTQFIKDTIVNQREFFLSGQTLSIEYRLDFLRKLKNELIENQQKIYDAFIQDYNKSNFDVLTTELAMLVMEINYFLKHLKKLARKEKKKTAIFNFPSKGYIYKEPYGVTLIIAPWNYPLQLSLTPLVGAIAAGNTVVLKPSSYSKNVADVIKEILDKFDSRHVCVIEGGRNEISSLLDEKFDYIFFTGGTTVGKIVLEKASKHVTPVTLELGGKSPCIVDKDANIKLAAKRITWGKYLNAGQTCVAPDYILIHKEVKEEFVKLVQQNIQSFYYENGQLTKDFPYIINEKHLNRLIGLIDEKKMVCGGFVKDRIIAPTILDNVTYEDAIMQEEIFGPIMPIITFNDLQKEVIDKLKYMEKPLSLYYFTNDKAKADYLLRNTTSGGGCINDTIMHLTNEDLPFGGVGFSGMGSYHGKKSFDTFSHQKSILVKGKAEISLKYPPYTSKKQKIVKKIMKLK